MTIPANWITVGLLAVGLLVVLTIAVLLLVLCVRLVAGSVRSVVRPGRHRASRTPAEADDAADEGHQHAGLNLPRTCAVHGTALHLIHPDGSGTCWKCRAEDIVEDLS
ncbi:hypothetical protein ABZ419_11155 [Streptomyces cinnamoneus]|uniref:hypothetical protein n=1 Tax=Streptomyces cinnamoneus TaxID=53446 RepID=UPI0033C2A192